LWTKEQRLPSGWKLFLYYTLAIVFVVNIGYFVEKLPGMLEEYNSYLYGNDRGRNRDFYVNLFWLGLFLCYRNKLVKIDPQNDFYLALFGLVCIVGFTGFFSPFIKRVAIYFSIFRCFLIGSLPLALQYPNMPDATFTYKRKDKPFQNVSLSNSVSRFSMPEGVTTINESSFFSFSNMMRIALYLAVFGYFFLSVYIIGHSDVLPYWNPDWIGYIR